MTSVFLYLFFGAFATEQTRFLLYHTPALFVKGKFVQILKIIFPKICASCLLYFLKNMI